MSLGNVPRRNMSAEDRGIQARLQLLDAMIQIHMAAGVEREAASRAAFAVVVKLNRKQAERELRELRLGVDRPSLL